MTVQAQAQQASGVVKASSSTVSTTSEATSHSSGSPNLRASALNSSNSSADRVTASEGSVFIVSLHSTIRARFNLDSSLCHSP
jgi:hypothetical protein